jgi:photosynthetic reaction center cytochrome c subunit
MSSVSLRTFSASLLVLLTVSACERPPVDAVQHGYRGTGMDLVYNPRIESKLSAANQALPAVTPPAEPGGVPATAVYKNIQVLTDLNVAQLTRVMLAMTAWVAPAGSSCDYCHAGSDLASDDNYRKVVSRQMLRMVRHLNSDWQNHVGGTGVTCYTCHRGNDVPQYVWYRDPGPPGTSDMLGNRDGHNFPSAQIGFTSLPSDPFEDFLASHPGNIRVVATTALAGSNTSSIKSTEQTYALMMHISQALGVNCTFCHNTRSFTSWDSSTPQRSTAWYGIRMVRDLNENYLEPLTPTFPADRKGPLSDVAKINCQTCHQGVFKPLYGVSMLKDYPELIGPATAAAAKAGGADVAEAGSSR